MLACGGLPSGEREAAWLDSADLPAKVREIANAVPGDRREGAPADGGRSAEGDSILALTESWHSGIRWRAADAMVRIAGE